MLPRDSDLELPLLILLEGENDVHFLKTLSAMLHRENPALPDLGQLTGERRAVFLPTGGGNVTQWMSRVTSLKKHAFYLFDREQEPETSRRRHLVDAINRRPGWYAGMTSKRALENYLHPQAIQEACGTDLRIDDDVDVTGLLARAMLLTDSGVSAWQELPCKR